MSRKTKACGSLIVLYLSLLAIPAQAGEVSAWGWDFFGPVSNTPLDSNFTAITAGDFHGYALRTDGSIAAWGNDDSGQVSDTPSGSGFIAVEGEARYGIALSADGSIAAWGSDNWALVSSAPTDSGFTTIAAGHSFSCALRSDGSIASWGGDSFGQVSNIPSESGFAAIAAGGSHAYALRADGSITAWGSDSDGQVSNTPSETGFTSIAAGDQHGYALRADGSIAAWGYDVSGQVSKTPEGPGFTAIAGGALQGYALGPLGSITAWGNDGLGEISDAPHGHGFTAIAAGDNFACALSTRFVPGDRLQGGLSEIGDLTQATFEGVKGMKLKLTFPATTTPMKSRVTVRDNQGAIVSDWTVNHAKKKKKTATLDHSGTHTLLVEAITGTPGPFEIKTSMKLPPHAMSSSKKKKGKGEPRVAEFKVLALPDGMIGGEFLPKNGFTGPMTVDVSLPNGTPFVVTTQSLGNGGLSVEAVQVDKGGEYVFKISGFGNGKEQVKGTLNLEQPPPGGDTVDLP